MKFFALLFAAALLIPLAACGSSAASTPSAPTAPITTTSAATSLTGTWTGTGTDAQGPETFRWTVTQTGDHITGSAIMDPGDPSDGSCASCHKKKSGTVDGTLTAGALTLTLDFPSGGSDITPLCGITMHATTSDVAAGRIAASYTGTTTCEGLITDGKLVVTR